MVVELVVPATAVIVLANFAIIFFKYRNNGKDNGKMLAKNLELMMERQEKFQDCLDVIKENGIKSTVLLEQIVNNTRMR